MLFRLESLLRRTPDTNDDTRMSLVTKIPAVAAASTVVGIYGGQKCRVEWSGHERGDE